MRLQIYNYYCTQKEDVLLTGKKASGEVIYSDLEIPKRIFSKVASSSCIVDYEEEISEVVYREQDAHKGDLDTSLS